jgi:2-polyprenyl-6-methoxyphenol hydroxylase-like FAD-dependent oxidoreductase
VTLPRASLVALGANISLEGDSQNVTADLLVGADGVPRAIRVVDQ